MDKPSFNIRIYGILIDDGKVLLTDEFRLGIFMTKFPGGGLQYGEGTIDCLKREFLEEMNAVVEVRSHYYTTDFFVASTLLPFQSQVINVYYLVDVAKPYPFVTTDRKFDFAEPGEGSQSFRWAEIKDLTEDDFTLPIDKALTSRLKKDFIQD